LGYPPPIALPSVVLAIWQMGEPTFTTRFHDLFCDRPRDRVVIGYAENKPFFTVELHRVDFLELI
jgi:hypothetical protein